MLFAGTSQRLAIHIKIRPAAASAKPTGVKSNMPKAVPVTCSRTSAKIIFGGVPIKVRVPPISEPNAIGINTCEALPLPLRASCNATGIIIAIAPVLFIKADNKVVNRVSATNCKKGRFSTRFIMPAKASTTPERHSAWLITKTAATVITAALPKPVNT
ncbi:MAG: Uncharacterised protein [Pseudidiomarina mangrovi]|nr:MAG: Uncharacterised protein [Pseudidiomarina mangrovi]